MNIEPLEPSRKLVVDNIGLSDTADCRYTSGMLVQWQRPFHGRLQIAISQGARGPDTRRTMHAALFVTLLQIVPAAMPEPAATAADTVVVCPRPFFQTLQPWLVYRAGQGHRVAIITETSTPLAIRAGIRRVAQGGRLRFVLLVGDAEPMGQDGGRAGLLSVPTYRAKAKINIHWGSEPEIATDNYYADLDDDGVPDVAVGRLTADSQSELATMVEKILAYERSGGQGLWRRRINFVAGLGGFGPVADSMLEMAAKKFITNDIPGAYETSMTYGSWRSPYCPDPRHFHLTTMQRINEGCLFWIYIGHGQRRQVDRVHVPGRTFHILGIEDMGKLHAAQGSPIAIFLTCYAGAFDEQQDCMAEEMLRRRGGPVAIVCGSRVTMPYAMAVMGTEMLRQCFHARRETLGELLLHTKRNMIAPEEKNANRQMLDALAAVISPAPEQLAAERAEHLLLFNLIGDPLLRLRLPDQLKLEVAAHASAGESLLVQGSSQLAGRCTLELVCRRDRLTFVPPVRQRFNPAGDALERFTDVYQRANNHRYAVETFDIAKGPFQKTIRVPLQARGPCHVRVFVQGERNIAIGAADVYIRRGEQNQ